MLILIFVSQFQNPVKVFGNNENTPPLKPRQIIFTSKSTSEVMNPVQTPFSQLSSIVAKNDSITSDESIAQLKDEIEYLKLSLEDKTKLADEANAETKKLKHEFDAEKDKLSKEIDALCGQINELQSKIEAIEAELVLATKNYDQKCSNLQKLETDFESLNGHLSEERANNGVMKQQLSSMENTIKFKDELIENFTKDVATKNNTEKLQLAEIDRLKRENSELAILNNSKTNEELKVNQKLHDEIAMLKETLVNTEEELAYKMISYEKCLLDMKEQEQKIIHLNDILTDSKTARSVEEFRIEIRTLRDENERLKQEIEGLMQRLSKRSTSPMPTDIDGPGIDEITSRVEKELNYGAQLDSNILKVMEKCDSDNEDDEDMDAIRAENKELEKAYEHIQDSLEAERQKFAFVHQQDANCIEVLKKRLELAIETEHELNKLLEEERSKTSQLSTKILEHQFERAKLSASNLSLNESPISSPRRLQKGGESDQELLKCQNDEIKLLKSQLEREKERAVDIERALTREKSRFEKEFTEQKAYGDRMKDELERIIRENKTLQEELDDAQEK